MRAEYMTRFTLSVMALFLTIVDEIAMTKFIRRILKSLEDTVDRARNI